MTKRLRENVFRRADGKCEGCGNSLTAEAGHMDHFFGRAKVPPLTSNCWALCMWCDDRKTRNVPSAAAWLRLFVSHCELHGYFSEAERAENKIAVLIAKGRAA